MLRNKDFFNNFYVNVPVSTKFAENNCILIYIVFLCCILCKERIKNKNFLHNFCVNDPVVTKFSEIILTLKIIVLTTNELSCLKITLVIRFL